MQIKTPLLCFCVQDIYAPRDEKASDPGNFYSVDGETAGTTARKILFPAWRLRRCIYVYVYVLPAF